MPRSWWMTMVCSIQTSATWIVYNGPYLDLQETSCYLNPYIPSPAQLILSGIFFHALHLLGHTTRSSMREYPSLILDRSHLQKVRVSVLFPNPHEDASFIWYFSQLIQGFHDWWLQSFHLAHPEIGTEWLSLVLPPPHFIRALLPLYPSLCKLIWSWISSSV